MAAQAEEKDWSETVENVATLDQKGDGDDVGFVENTIEEKKLVRKVDLYLMPTIWVLYCLSYMVSRKCPRCLAQN